MKAEGIEYEANVFRPPNTLRHRCDNSKSSFVGFWNYFHTFNSFNNDVHWYIYYIYLFISQTEYKISMQNNTMVVVKHEGGDSVHRNVPVSESVTFLSILIRNKELLLSLFLWCHFVEFGASNFYSSSRLGLFTCCKDSSCSAGNDCSVLQSQCKSSDEVIVWILICCWFSFIARKSTGPLLISYLSI